LAEKFLKIFENFWKFLKIFGIAAKFSALLQFNFSFKIYFSKFHPANFFLFSLNIIEGSIFLFLSCSKG